MKVQVTGGTPVVYGPGLDEFIWLGNVAGHTKPGGGAQFFEQVKYEKANILIIINVN